MLSELIKSKIPAIQIRTTEEHRVGQFERFGNAKELEKSKTYQNLLTSIQATIIMPFTGVVA